MREVGRGLGAAASLGVVALWAQFLFSNPYAAPAEGPAQLFGMLMMVAGAMSVGAAAMGAHLAMYLMFAVSFFPVGIYLMMGPGIFQAIGWLDLAYLAAAMLVHRRVSAGS